MGPKAHAPCASLSSPSWPPPRFPSRAAAPLGVGTLEGAHPPPPPPRRCAAAGWSLPQPLPLSLLDQGMGDVTGLYVC